MRGSNGLVILLSVVLILVLFCWIRNAVGGYMRTVAQAVQAAQR